MLNLGTAAIVRAIPALIKASVYAANWPLLSEAGRGKTEIGCGKPSAEAVSGLQRQRAECKNVLFDIKLHLPRAQFSKNLPCLRCEIATYKITYFRIGVFVIRIAVNF